MGGAKGSGAGTAQGAGRTEGLYRTLTDTSDMYLVRTAVVNTVRLQDGTQVSQDGEVTFFIDAAHVLARAQAGHRDQFEDPSGVLDADLAAAAQSGRRDPAGSRQAPRSLADGRLWGGVWTDTIGAGPLAAAVSQAAAELGGQSLRVQVEPVLTGLSVKLPQLGDGGAVWPFTAGGKDFELTLRADPVGAPRHQGDTGAGMKMYTRANRSTIQKWRSTHPWTATLFTFGKRLAERFYLNLSGQLVRTTTPELLRQHATNLLVMDGERPKGTAEFVQDLQFSYTLQQLPRTVDAVGQWQRRFAPDRLQRSGMVTETRTIHAPKDGSTPHDRAVVTWNGTPANQLPPDVTVHGVHGLAAIDTPTARRYDKPVPAAAWHPPNRRTPSSTANRCYPDSATCSPPAAPATPPSPPPPVKPDSPTA
jgi:hypothetical protein